MKAFFGWVLFAVLFCLAVTSASAEEKTEYTYVEYPLERAGVSLHLDLLARLGVYYDRGLHAGAGGCYFVTEVADG